MKLNGAATQESRGDAGFEKVGSRAAGFTLIELMIAVAVVAILAAIAFPSYQDQVRKSRRAQAKADLVELAQVLERYRTVKNTYAGTVPGLFNQSPRTGVAQYGIVLSAQASGTYLLTATPTATSGQNKDTCGTLTINQASAKTSKGASNPACF